MPDLRGKHERLRKAPVYERPSRDDVRADWSPLRSVSLEDAPLLTRRLTASTGLDLGAMTMPVTIASETPVPRVDEKGRPFMEVLLASGFETGGREDVKFVENHNMRRLTHTLGRVSNFRREGEEIVADVRFSTAQDVEPIAQRYADGTLTDVSVGYRVLEWRETVENGVRTRTAVRWVLIEVSAVIQGADPRARTKRSATRMEDEVETVERVDPPTETRTAADPASVRNITRAAGMSSAQADELINRGATSEEVRGAVGAHFETRSRATPRIQVVGSHDDPAAIVRRQTDAMVYRMAGGDLPADARQFVEMSFRDHATSALERAGVSTRGMTADEIFVRAGTHTTSDYPLIVSNAMNKVALDRFKAAESELVPLCWKTSISNFKDSTAIRAGELGRLLEMTEVGEFRQATRAEAGESMHLRTFGRALDVSRKLQVDDDQGMLGDMTGAFGDAAAQTIADELATLVTSNPNMRDGTAVFAVGRGNVGTASAITPEALGEAKQAMRLRKGLDGATLINATPKYLVVGADREVEAQKVLASIQPGTVDDVNVFAGKLALIVEPRLEGEWFLFADPARLRTMRLAYLSGAQGVQIQRSEAWDTLGTRFRAWLDFGCGWVDWRGAHRNAGD